MSMFEDMIAAGVDVRERQGKAEESKWYFEQALANAANSKQEAEAYGQLGLSHEHLDEYEEALSCYSTTLDLAIESHELATIARAKRHISSILLEQGNLTDALSYAKEAYNIIHSLGHMPADAVWITHGVLKILYAHNKPDLNEIRVWVRHEYHDLGYMLFVAKNAEKIACRVWITGFFADAGRAWLPWSLPLLGVGFFLSKIWGLKIRTNQAKEFLRKKGR